MTNKKTTIGYLFVIRHPSSVIRYLAAASNSFCMAGTIMIRSSA